MALFGSASGHPRDLFYFRLLRERRIRGETHRPSVHVSLCYAGRKQTWHNSFILYRKFCRWHGWQLLTKKYVRTKLVALPWGRVKAKLFDRVVSFEWIKILGEAARLTEHKILSSPCQKDWKCIKRRKKHQRNFQSIFIDMKLHTSGHILSFNGIPPPPSIFFRAKLFAVTHKLCHKNKKHRFCRKVKNCRRSSIVGSGDSCALHTRNFIEPSQKRILATPLSHSLPNLFVNKNRTKTASTPESYLYPIPYNIPWDLDRICLKKKRIDVHLEVICGGVRLGYFWILLGISSARENVRVVVVEFSLGIFRLDHLLLPDTDKKMSTRNISAFEVHLHHVNKLLELLLIGLKTILFETPSQKVFYIFSLFHRTRFCSSWYNTRKWVRIFSSHVQPVGVRGKSPSQMRLEDTSISRKYAGFHQCFYYQCCSNDGEQSIGNYCIHVAAEIS